MFAAYIASFLPNDNPDLRNSRTQVTQRQIRWWMEKTEVPVNVIAMNYSEDDFLRGFPKDRLQYHVNPPMKLTPARAVGFEMFYKSDYDFGIMMDDDAILYDKEHHNSGPNLFAEMSQQIDKYHEVDVFFPINPQKIGFNPIWDKNVTRYRDNHVFKRTLDLKGSMFVVRNFRKYDKTIVMPDLDYNWQEDTKFAIDSIAAGHTVMQSHNIVLNELSGKASHFAASANLRVPRMLEGNTRIAKQYEEMGLRMVPDSHLLDKKDFMKFVWGNKPVDVVVPKPQAGFHDAFDI